MASPGVVVLFLASDPDLAARRAASPAPVGVISRVVMPVRFLAAGRGPPPRAGGDLPPAFPADQVMCATRAREAAKRAGRTVRVVDVNDPGEDRQLVERYIAATDILPVLLRSDGARLEGAESFAPRTLRQFLQHV